MGTDWRVEERLREKLALLSQELSETRAALDAVRADLAASEKAREEADAYAGRANARIADLGERLDATEAVLRDAEKARKEAERERDAYRHEWNVSSRQQGAETRARYAAESRAARLLTAMREIEGKTGHFGEAPPPPEWMPMLSLIAWVGKTARATLAEVGE